MRLRTRSADATRELAAAIGALLGVGDVLVLAGDLGAGKTTFTQGLAASLGVTVPVTSPTFTLVHEYSGLVPIVHIDVYRLEHLQEVHDLGFDELVGGDAVVVVEWGDILGPLLPPDRLQLSVRVRDRRREHTFRPAHPARLELGRPRRRARDRDHRRSRSA